MHTGNGCEWKEATPFYKCQTLLVTRLWKQQLSHHCNQWIHASISLLSPPDLHDLHMCVHRLMRDPSGFIPSPMERYRQILLPTLRLFQVILTSTAMNHQQGAAQVRDVSVITCLL